MSDHSFIAGSITLGIDSDCHVIKVVDRRRWRDLDSASFSADLVNSRLVADPPGDIDTLFACYDETLKSLVDMHAPLKKMKVSFRPAGCCAVKINTQRLEHQNRQYHTPSTNTAWKRLSRFPRYYLQERYKEYWTSTINANLGDFKLLWSKVNSLLWEAPKSISCLHTADDFAMHCNNKVSKIHGLNLSAPPAIIQPRITANLSVTASEITKIIMYSLRNIVHSIRLQHGLSSSSVRFWCP